MLAWQLAGLAAIIAWTAVLCTIMFGILKLLGIFRVSEEMERKGLDIPKHGEPAYPLESYGHGYTETILTINDSGNLLTQKQGYAHVNNGLTPEDGLYESTESKNMKHNPSEVTITPATAPQGNGNGQHSAKVAPAEHVETTPM
ncbi:ammonium transporter [Elysia marginata]|uniref:Ammonium transporter n=1 Tax=Elysia marginata TaxID=1093978 RepID=A0AAV4IYM6_9GAST|nr:ammonium transporter [Elysia marginata]